MFPQGSPKLHIESIVLGFHVVYTSGHPVCHKSIFLTAKMPLSLSCHSTPISWLVCLVQSPAGDYLVSAQHVTTQSLLWNGGLSEARGPCDPALLGHHPSGQGCAVGQFEPFLWDSKEESETGNLIFELGSVHFIFSQWTK